MNSPLTCEVHSHSTQYFTHRNTTKLNKAVNFTYTPSFQRKTLPLFAITGDRAVIHFDSVFEAARKIGVSISAINHCLQKQLKTCGGLIFRRPKDILNRQGDICKKQVTKHAKKLKNICIIDNKLSIYSPLNREDAENILGFSYNKIRQHSINRTLTPNDKVIVERAEIEDAFGNLDIQKAHNLNKAIRKKRKGEGFYAVNQQYKSILWQRGAQFAKEHGISRTSVYRCIEGKTKTIKGYALITRSAVEDATGKLDRKKLKAEANKRFFDRKKRALEGISQIIAFHPNGEMKAFKTMKEAADYTHRGMTTISDILKGKKKAQSDNWFYTYTYQFRDENGKIDKGKLKKYFLTSFMN